MRTAWQQRAHPIIKQLLLAAAGIFSTISWGTAYSNNVDSYPEKPISITIGSAPGAIDTLVRMLTESLADKLGQPVVVLNKPGANGLLAVEDVRQSKPDGYNILFATTSTMVINPFVYKSANYHAAEDFEPIGHHTFMPMVWIANKESGFKNLGDVIRAAKENPDSVFMGNHGAGGAAAILETAFAKVHDLDIVLVPHPSAAQSIMRLLANDVQVNVETLSTIMPRIKQNEVTPLAITGGTRLDSLPDVPSWTEFGMPEDHGILFWYGFFAPKGTPKPIVDKLNEAINDAVQQPKVRDFMESMGGTIVPLSSDEFRNQVIKDRDFFARLLPTLDISPQ